MRFAGINRAKHFSWSEESAAECNRTGGEQRSKYQLLLEGRDMHCSQKTFWEVSRREKRFWVISYVNKFYAVKYLLIDCPH